MSNSSSLTSLESEKFSWKKMFIQLIYFTVGLLVAGVLFSILLMGLPEIHDQRLAPQWIQTVYVFFIKGWGFFNSLTLICILGFGLIPYHKKLSLDVLWVVIGVSFGIIFGFILESVLSIISVSLLGFILGYFLGYVIGSVLGNILWITLKEVSGYLSKNCKILCKNIPIIIKKN